ncbi:hypothetical protein LOZ65_006091 [Ophidiomyces ophidiicola]|nr:hypothetical protein LOZ65_006091 [Ophidiomyces ophidiicola]
MGAEVYGDAVSSHTEGDSSPIKSETSTNMSWPVPAEISPQHLPILPTHAAPQSNSVPATPFHSLRFSSRSRSRSPSPNRSRGSPHSAHSEYNHILPHRKQYGGCKYETAMSHFRRRMPYSLGADLLPEELSPQQEVLGSEEERKLTSDMNELYNTLLPSQESEERRKKFVQKLESLLNTKWPGNDIQVHVFGSSGNKLCSSDSDVDICITTPFKELEQVCLLAEFLANNGMERVVCVSHAKVPIVKIWDPELQVACDMNVNNTLALENTRMIRTYVDADERVRPLAMAIKYWTKRRILNDAALGGTLSSYTWICLIVNFLQTQSPPILPSLQQRAIDKQKVQGKGNPSPSFDDDLETLAGFGKENKSTLGELLFQFFRYYGYELDYEKNVISVREGKLISKEKKGWHLLQNNRLCVEEPFNTSRNLGNTADDTSFRGLHLELRRAFEALCKGDLKRCCEQYEYPPEEERTWERPAPQPRAILTPMPAGPSRGGRGGGRGGRHASHYNRGPNSIGRRASNAANRNNSRPANPSFTTDIALQAQQAQNILHDHLYQRIQILQAQEHELRLQLQNQALMTGRQPPTLIRQPYLQFPLPQNEPLPPDEHQRNRSGSINQPPLTAPIRQNVFFNSIPVTLPVVQGTNTNPPSPSLPSAVPDSRRNHRRSSVAATSPRGLRTQSQPPRPLPSAIIPTIPVYHPVMPQDMGLRRSPEFSQRTAAEGDAYVPNGVPISRSTSIDENLTSEYVGYYVGDTVQVPRPYQNHLVSPLPGLMVPGYLNNSPEYRPYPAPPDPSNNSPEHLTHLKATSQFPQVSRLNRSQTMPDCGPLIIDGSIPPSEQRNSIYNHSTDQFMTDFSTSSSAERVYDTPRTTPDTLSQGLHERGSYDDLFGSSFEAQQGCQNSGHVNGWGSALDHNDLAATGHMGRVETLSERLQRFQLSDPSYIPDTTGNSDISQYRGTQYLYPVDDQLSAIHTNGSPKGHPTQLINALPTSEKDSRVLSPTVKHTIHSFDWESANNASFKPKNKVHASTHTNGDSAEKQAEYSRKVNGVIPLHIGSTNGHHVPATNVWQTTKRRSKKGPKTLTEQNDFKTRVDSLSTDESMKKGG